MNKLATRSATLLVILCFVGAAYMDWGRGWYGIVAFDLALVGFLVWNQLDWEKRIGRIGK